MKRRVAITGLGALTALGEGADALWRGVLAGKSGIAPTEFGSNGDRLKVFGAPVPGFEPEKFITQRKSLKVMARDIQLAVAAAALAVRDAGLTEAGSAPRERFGVVVGSGVLNHELDELASSVLASIGDDGKLDMSKFGSAGMSSLFPLWLLKYLPNMPACHISILFDLQGPSNTLTTGACAGLQAVCEAARIIRRGSADAMLAGGAESKLNPLGLSQYRVKGVLSEGDASSSRPFDRNSKGLLVGEGSAFLVLEEWKHAKARGAAIYAEVTGCGIAGSEERALSMRAALSDAGVKASELDALQACGIGVSEDDRREAAAIEEVFTDARDLAVSVSKPLLGFTGYSAGAVDLVLSALAIRHQAVPPVPSAAATGCQYGFRLVSGQPAKKKIRHAMTHASGLDGECVSVVLSGEPR